jgi:hypothetical protein
VRAWAAAAVARERRRLCTEVCERARRVLRRVGGGGSSGEKACLLGCGGGGDRLRVVGRDLIQDLGRRHRAEARADQHVLRVCGRSGTATRGARDGRARRRAAGGGRSHAGLTVTSCPFFPTPFTSDESSTCTCPPLPAPFFFAFAIATGGRSAREQAGRAGRTSSGRTLKAVADAASSARATRTYFERLIISGCNQSYRRH